MFNKSDSRKGPFSYANTTTDHKEFMLGSQVMLSKENLDMLTQRLEIVESQNSDLTKLISLL